MPFEATVRQGPDAGTSYTGFLALFVAPDGGIDSGAFATTDGRTVPVVGQANGRAVNLVLALGSDQTIYGVGTSATDLATCHGWHQGAMGGPLVGPKAADFGDWAVAEITTATRSPMCKSCLQSCRANQPAPYGFAPGTCQALCEAAGACTAADFGG